MTDARLVPGNLKLGPLIYSWSITAGETCPGETELCRSRCYAKQGRYHMSNVKAALHRNMKFTRSSRFAAWMIGEITWLHARVIRVHVSGDFYSEAYVEKWEEIVRACPDAVFYTYTRSWRVDDIFPSLLRLAKASNVYMWWSTDRETGPAPVVPGVRSAYMAIDDADASSAPPGSDLVFRVRPKTVMTMANGVPVCPVETGRQHETKPTCSTCGLCWRAKSKPKSTRLLESA